MRAAAAAAHHQDRIDVLDAGESVDGPGDLRRRLKEATIFPASHYVTKTTTLKRATETITAELKEVYNPIWFAEMVEQESAFRREIVRRMAIDVDRMNSTEKAQTWVDTLVRSAILAGIVL